MSRAIMEFGEILEKSVDYVTVGNGGPFLAYAKPGDIIVKGEAPENPNGRVCAVQMMEKGEKMTYFCRVYVDGDKVALGYMDDYDLWDTKHASEVKITGEVLGVFHKYDPLEERPNAEETAFYKRAKKALRKWCSKFRWEVFNGLLTHSEHSTYTTLATAFSLGYEAGVTHQKREAKKA